MRKIVLVRPEGPRNVGMVLRTATNFGSINVVLVDPRRPSMLKHPDFEQMSHGVANIEERVQIVDSLETALADCTHAVGFTARPRVQRPFHDWRVAAPEVAEKCNAEDHMVGLVFGNEVEGLAQVETDLCHELVHIRTSGEHTSLNLSMAVGIALYATFTDTGARAPRQAGNDAHGRRARVSQSAHGGCVCGHCALGFGAQGHPRFDSPRDLDRATRDARRARLARDHAGARRRSAAR